MNESTKSEKEGLSKLDDEINLLNFKIDVYNSITQRFEKWFKCVQDIKILSNQEKEKRKEMKEICHKSQILEEHIQDKKKALQVTDINYSQSVEYGYQIKKS